MSMSKKSNRKAREMAFGALFAARVGNRDIDDALKEVLISDETSGIKGIIEKKIRLWKEHQDSIDRSISELLDRGRIEELSGVALSALRLGLCEMEYMDDIPEIVAINEAVELSKKYGDESIGRFVNGIMDARLKKLRKKGDEVEERGKRQPSGADGENKEN